MYRLKVLEMYLKGRGQGQNVIDIGVIWKGLISWAYMPNMKYLSLTRVMAMVKVFLPQSHRQTESQTGQKLDAPEFHSRGIKNV